MNIKCLFHTTVCLAYSYAHLLAMKQVIRPILQMIVAELSSARDAFSDYSGIILRYHQALEGLTNLSCDFMKHDFITLWEFIMKNNFEF